jgi:Tol biopolymer transport system component
MKVNAIREKLLKNWATRLFALILVLALPVSLSASVGGHSVRAVSASTGSVLADETCHHPSITADGSKVAFRSTAENLVPGDTNGVEDIFIKDIDTGSIIMASSTSDGEPADGASQEPAISADGNFITFVSVATNLAPGASGGSMQAFVKNLLTGEVMLASASSQGVEGDDSSEKTVISADGRFVAFSSNASNLVPGDTNGTLDVFLRDIASGSLIRVSEGPQGQEGNGPSGYNYGPSISADGRYVAFGSGASDLLPSDPDDVQDIFVKDVQSGDLKLASVTQEGVKGNDLSLGPSISANGDRVVFRTFATNFSPVDGQRQSDVYLKDLANGSLTLVSTDENGNRIDMGGYDQSIAGDGMSAAFVVNTSTLGIPVPRDSVYRKDFSDGSLDLVSAESSGTPGNGGSISPSLSSDGLSIAYESQSTNLTGSGSPDIYNIFLTIFQSGEGELPGENPGSSGCS